MSGNLVWRQYVMIEDEPFPGTIEGFMDDGTISVNFADGGGRRYITRQDITWSGYLPEDWLAS